MSVDRAELLRRSPLFAAMPADTVDELARRATRRRVRAGQRVLARSDAAVVVVVTGRLEVLADDHSVVRSVAPPAALGISLAVAPRSPAAAELRAGEASELVVVPAAALAAALRHDPDAAIAAIVHLGGVIAELSAELERMRRHGTIERVRHRLEQLGRGRRELTITHAQLAEEIGGTRANVSRALARLEQEGAIVRRRGRIELKT